MAFKMKGWSPFNQDASLEEVEAASEEQQQSGTGHVGQEQRSEQLETKLNKLYEALEAATTPAIREGIQEQIDALLKKNPGIKTVGGE